METYDLNLDNYNLEDILNLFHLEYDFTENNLREAKKVVLQTPPDNSDLDSKYFIFFKKAYEIVCRIYYFRFRKKKEKRPIQETIELCSDKKIILYKIKDGDKTQFNKWFNEMFEKVKISTGEDEGYEEWFRSDENCQEQKKISLSQFDNEFHKYKKQCKSNAIIVDVVEMGGNEGYNLTGDKPVAFSSPVFSNLSFEDLKKAHTETVIPVTREDYLKKPKFSNVDSYKSYRDKQNIAPPSLQQSQNYLVQKNRENAEGDVRRIYKILKQDEKIKESNEKWWGSLKHLTN